MVEIARYSVHFTRAASVEFTSVAAGQLEARDKLMAVPRLFVLPIITVDSILTYLMASGRDSGPIRPTDHAAIEHRRQIEHVIFRQFAS